MNGTGRGDIKPADGRHRKRKIAPPRFTRRRLPSGCR
jgi:hypothetical protein